MRKIYWVQAIGSSRMVKDTWSRAELSHSSLVEIHLPSVEPQIHKQVNQDPAKSSQDQPTLSRPTDPGEEKWF